MRPRRLMTRQTLLLTGMLLTAASCSFLYDLDQVQCEVRDDCTGYPDSADVACIEGTCTILNNNTTSTTTSPTTSTTGAAGGGGAPGCQDNDECIEEKYGPAICRDGECIALATDECPVVLGTGEDFKNLKSPKEPFIFGAYSILGTTVAENTAPIANYDFAINEVNRATADGYSYAGARRPFVAVVCNHSGDLAISMEHLVKTLEVPAVISTMLSTALLPVFENEDWGPRENNVFVLSTTFADSTLTNPDVDPDRLLWHMLGDGVDQAGAYEPLVEQAEAYLRAQQSIPAEEPIRVAMVVADDPFLKDVASVVTSTVHFNGRTAIQNAQEEDAEGRELFQRVDIDSIFHTSDVETSLNEAYMVLDEMEPHLVLAITSSEFLYQNLLPNLETVWNATKEQAPPFYLFSPYIARSLTLKVAQDFEEPPEGPPPSPTFLPLRQRILGVTPAGAADTTLYETYLLEFESEYKHLIEDGVSLAGTENYYDAAYFTMYAIHGGGPVTNLTGVNVSTGMTRLLGPGDPFPVGPTYADAVIDELRSGEEDGYITLNGTMGPPDFRPSGARVNFPSIYCIDLDPDPDAIDGAMAFFPDVIDYTPGEEGDGGTLTSTEDPCSIAGFMETP